jgi:hypothetical protein
VQSGLILQNLLSAPVLFFFLGVLAVLVGSDLEIPSPLPKLFSLYLLLAIGFKGGLELAHSGLTSLVLLTIGAAVAMSLLVPLSSFLVLRTRLDAANAAAVAASYGSISAVTFITAESFLTILQIHFDGFMVAALALMESPAIVVGVVLAKLAGRQGGGAQPLRWREVLQEAFLNGSVFLLIGSLVIGFLVTAFSPSGLARMEPFTDKLFYGALCFFLLDMGLVAAQRLQDLRRAGAFLVGFAVLAPLAHAALGLLLSRLLGLGVGDALLFMVLCASASYIAVPAAMRMTVPEANPSLYISSALGVTFPFNVVVGIPLYLALAQRFLPAS